jgi:hypothetical protein
LAQVAQVTAGIDDMPSSPHSDDSPRAAMQKAEAAERLAEAAAVEAARGLRFAPYAVAVANRTFADAGEAARVADEQCGLPSWGGNKHSAKTITKLRTGNNPNMNTQ